MKILCRSGWIGNPHVGFSSQSKKTLDARTGMIWSLAFISMWQKQNQRRCESPLRSPREQEFIKHRLSDVDEVTVLRFPHNESFWSLHIIANFKTNCASLAQRAIQNFKRGFDLRDGLHRYITLICFRIIKSGMPLTESPAHGIFTGQSDGDAVFEDRGKCQFFCGGPIYISVVRFIEQFAASFNCFYQFWIQMKRFRKLHQRLIQFFQAFEGNLSLDLLCGTTWRDFRDRFL